MRPSREVTRSDAAVWREALPRRKGDYEMPNARSDWYAISDNR